MDKDSRHNWTLVRTPTGIDWSGRTRYAAAMYFFQKGEMSAEVLEVYRICSRLDSEDPLSVLKRWKIGEDWIGRMEAGPDYSMSRENGKRSRDKDMRKNKEPKRDERI